MSVEAKKIEKKMKSYCPPPSPPDFSNIPSVAKGGGGKGGGQEQAKNDNFNMRPFFRGSGRLL